MKILRYIGKVFFWLLILALLVTPIWMLFQLSQMELAQYAPEAPPVILDSAYGEIMVAQRGDLEEFVRVSGEYVSDTYVYMELDYKDNSLIRWEVSPGDLVLQGQKLGTYKDEAVIASATGIITQIRDYGEDSYLQLQSIHPVVLECQVNDQTLSSMEQSQSLATQDGAAVQILYRSPVKNPNGTTTVRLSIENTDDCYGMFEQDLRLYTGRIYRGVLMLDADCVYQKESGEEQPWYVRQVTPEGTFLREIEVGIGYSDGSRVCVTGIEEGTWYDAGYKALMAGDSK